MTTTLYRKYRPQTFAEVVGQKHVVQTLTNALKLGRVGQAYLFTGPRGTGKTTLARLFAKAVNCSKRKGSEPCNKCEHCLLMNEGRSLDVIEIDAASHTGVDNIRELRETVALPPTLGSHKIYIIDEVHMLSQGAFNALLKTLEEPPAHVIFILATTALHKVPDTIVSRTQRFDLGRFPVKAIVGKLEKIAKEEKLKIEKGALEMIAVTAEGGMRDAESLLTQIASLEESPITEEKVMEVLGTTKKENVTELLRHISERELFPALNFVRQLSQDGTNLAVFAGVLLHSLRDLLLVAVDKDSGPDQLDSLTEEQIKTLVELAGTFTPAEIVRMLEFFQIAERDTKTAVVQELPLEIAIVKILTEGQRGAPSRTPDKKTPEELPKSRLIASETESKKPEPPIVASQAEETPTGPEIELHTFQQNWNTILEKAKELNASLSVALSTAHPHETEGNTLIIGVKYPFHKERLDQPANRATLSQAFASILGTKIGIKIAVDNQPETKKEASPAQDFPEDSLTRQALEMLGGTIVPES